MRNMIKILDEKKNKNKLVGNKVKKECNVKYKI